MTSSGNTCKDCSCHLSSAASQNLDELDFERGIWSAAVDGDVEKIRRHLSRSNAEANFKDSAGYTALHYACRHGRVDSVRLLLTAGAHVNCRTASGLATPIHRAAYAGHTKVVEILLDHGADACLRDFDGRTAFHKAAEGGQQAVIELLLRRGVGDISTKDQRGLTPVEILPPHCQHLKNLLNGIE